MKPLTYRIPVYAAAALSLLASASSCTKVNIDNPDLAEQYIGFTSSVGTKAAVESAANMKEFAVWAAYYIDGDLDNELPMYEVRVYREDNLWLYDELKLWEEGAWHFEAFYPLPSTLAATGVVREDALSVGFTAPKNEEQPGLEGLSINYYYGPTASHDLMTAEHTRTYSSASPDASPVQFEFKHLLSRVSIAVKAASEGVTLSSLTFEGMSILGEYNTVEDEPDTWHLLTSIPELSNVQPGSFPADLTEVAAPLPSNGTSVDVLSDLLLIPQTPGDGTNGLDLITLKVTYAIGDAQPENKTITLPPDPAWQPGHHYRYTLTLGGADVTLSVEMVQWDERDYTVIF